MTKRITQAEARRLRRRVRELESKVDRITTSYGLDYPGTWIASMLASDVLSARIDTARRIGHTIIARKSGSEIHFYAAEKSS